MKMLELKTVDDLVRLIQVCVWAFVVVILMMVFGGIVSAMLYSVIFVSQPIKSMAPIDQAFTKMLNDIVLIMASSITTIVGMFAINKGSQALAEKLAPSLGLPPSQPCPPSPTQPKPYGGADSVIPDFNWMGYSNPELDESWTPGPPPTTPPDYIDPSAEEIAHERAAAKGEA